MAIRRTTNPGFQSPRYRQLIERLADERRRQQMTQEALAEKLGTHKQFVSRVELGERRLDVVEFVDFARALGLNVAELLERV